MYVYFDHDGGVDDLLCVLFLCKMSDVKLLGVSITPADCYISPALSATEKILSLCSRADIPIALGCLAGRHEFPTVWRDQSELADRVLQPIASSFPMTSPLPAHEFLITTLLKSSERVTLLFTGPLTNLAAALEQKPEIVDKIERLVWMGGAIDVPGNVSCSENLYDYSNATAEWNSYWDSEAVRKVWDSRIPITLVSLDATNEVPVSKEFLEKLQEQQSSWSDLAYKLWGITSNDLYHMWDTLACLLMRYPELSEYENVFCEVITKGTNEGQIQRSSTGRLVQMAIRPKVAEIHQKIYSLLT